MPAALDWTSGARSGDRHGWHVHLHGLGCPSQLKRESGVMLNRGDKQTIVVPNADTFPITCLIHPAMQATVTVTLKAARLGLGLSV